MRTIRAFVKSAERLNLTLAANDLHQTQSAISQQIKQLEEQVGLTLFHRQRRGLMLTADGMALYKAIRPVLYDLQHIFANVSSGGSSQCIRLWVDHSLLAARLAPRLGALIQSCGSLKLEVAGADIGEYVGFDRNTILIGPYGTWGGHPDFRSHTVACGKPIVVARADYREPGSRLRNTAPLNLFTTKKLQSELGTLRQELLHHRLEGIQATEVSCVLVGNQALALEAAQGSDGMALVDEVVACPYIESGSLVAVATLSEGRTDHYDFQCHNELLSLRGVRTLLDWIQKELTPAPVPLHLRIPTSPHRSIV